MPSNGPVFTSEAVVDSTREALVNSNKIYSGIFTCTDRPSDFRNSLFVGRALELLRSRVQEMEDEDPLQFTHIMRN
jgi:hypothetical protein